jgi:hypothetical protein
VQHQRPGGDVTLWRSQLWLASGVKTFDHLELADIGRIFLGRGVEIEFALLIAVAISIACSPTAFGTPTHSAGNEVPIIECGRDFFLFALAHGRFAEVLERLSWRF